MSLTEKITVTHKSIFVLLLVTVIVLIGSIHDVSALNSTATTVLPISTTVNLGSQATFSASVVNTNGTGAITGNILWNDNNAHGIFVPTFCPLPGSGCTTSYSPAANSSSTVTISAAYTGDNAHYPSSGTSLLTVNRFHPTTTTVTPNSGSINSGSQITFSASVSDTTATPTTPSGNVTWSDNNAGGKFSTSVCNLPSGGCTTSYTSSVNSPSSVTITASYTGDSTHSGSAGVSSLQVNLLHQTITKLVPSPATLSSNGTVKFIVKVNDSSSSPTIPIGTVSWKDGNVGGFFNVTSCTLSSGVCSSMYTASGNPPNTITVNATYSGDNTHSTSSAVSKVSTNVLYSTTTTVTANPATFTPGNPVSLTVTVVDTSNPSAALIGLVTWNDYGAGGTFTPTGCALSGNHCSLTYTPSAQPPSTISIAASYIGDSYHSGSSGASSLSVVTSTPPSTPPPSTPPPSTPPPSTPPPSTPPPTEQNNTQGSNVPEFPIASIILLIAISSLVVFYKIRPTRI